MNLLQNSYASFVNLDHRMDRRTHMLRELARVNIQAERTKGRHPAEFSDPRFSVMRSRTPGAIGCYMSQISIKQRALSLGKHAFVMEDDLVFCSDIHTRLDYISEWMEKNEWDVFWLGGTFHSPAFWHPAGQSKMKPNCSAGIGKDCDKTNDIRIMRTYGAFSTHAYIVNHISIQKVLDMLDGVLHESIGIDWSYIKIQPKIKAFAFVPGCVKQYDNKSDIGTGITKYSGFAQLNGTLLNSTYWWQDKMEQFNPQAFTWR